MPLTLRQVLVSGCWLLGSCHGFACAVPTPHAFPLLLLVTFFPGLRVSWPPWPQCCCAPLLDGDVHLPFWLSCSRQSCLPPVGPRHRRRFRHRHHDRPRPPRGCRRRHRGRTPRHARLLAGRLCRRHARLLAGRLRLRCRRLRLTLRHHLSLVKKNGVVVVGGDAAEIEVDSGSAACEGCESCARLLLLIK